MKKSLLVLSLLAAASPLFAQDFVAPVAPHKHVPPPARVRPPVPFEGAIPRGFHSGHPLQMLNPFAPKEYGSGAELVYHEESDPFQRPPPKTPRAQGIKLFVIEF